MNFKRLGTGEMILKGCKVQINEKSIILAVPEVYIRVKYEDSINKDTAKLFLNIKNSCSQAVIRHEKTCLCHMRTTKVQII